MCGGTEFYYCKTRVVYLFIFRHSVFFLFSYVMLYAFYTLSGYFMKSILSNSVGNELCEKGYISFAKLQDLHALVPFYI